MFKFQIITEREGKVQNVTFNMVPTERDIYQAKASNLDLGEVMRRRLNRESAEDHVTWIRAA